MRLFAAARLDPATRAAIAASADAVRQCLPDDFRARWIPEDDLHITLWFLGEVDNVRVPAVAAALEPPFGLRPFSIELSGLGAFPGTGAPRVIWTGVSRGASELSRLHHAIGGRLEPLGFRREGRPYTAHVTIARVKDPGRAATRAVLRQALLELPADAGPSQVGDVTLFESRSSPKGSRYEPVLRVPLNG